MVERFTVTDDPEYGAYAALDPNGACVRFSDYEALQKELAEARVERDYWKNVHYKGIVVGKDLAKLHNEALNAAEASATALLAEVDRLRKELAR